MSSPLFRKLMDFISVREMTTALILLEQKKNLFVKQSNFTICYGPFLVVICVQFSKFFVQNRWMSSKLKGKKKVNFFTTFKKLIKCLRSQNRDPQSFTSRVIILRVKPKGKF
jgi:hypothetical protein